MKKLKFHSKGKKLTSLLLTVSLIFTSTSLTFAGSDWGDDIEIPVGTESDAREPEEGFKSTSSDAEILEEETVKIEKKDSKATPGLVFDATTNTITGYTGTDVDVVIPESIGNVDVLHIGPSAFVSNTKIETVTFPQGLLSIGRLAFSGCTALVVADLPEGLTTLEQHAFSGCRKLKKVHVPGTVDTIETGAFNNCDGIETVTFGEGVRVIRESAFMFASSIKSIVLPNSVEAIERWAFRSASKLEKVEIGNGIKSINTAGFSGCTRLKDINVRVYESQLTGAPWGATNSTVKFMTDETGFSHVVSSVSGKYGREISINATLVDGIQFIETIELPDSTSILVKDTKWPANGTYVYNITNNGTYTFTGTGTDGTVISYDIIIDDIGIPVLTAQSATVNLWEIDQITKDEVLSLMKASAYDELGTRSVEISDAELAKVRSLANPGDVATVTITTTSGTGTMVQQQVDIIATETRQNVTFQIRSGDEAFGSLSMTQVDVRKGDTLGNLVPTVTPVPDYRLIGWYKDGKQIVDLSKERIIDDSVYEARFEKYIFGVEFQIRKGDEAYGTISNQKVKVEEGKEIGTLAPTVTPAPDYRLIGWYKDGKQIVDLSKERIIEDSVYEARFKKYIFGVEFQVRKGDEAYGTISGQKVKVEEGHTLGNLVPTVTPVPDYRLIGWYKDGKQIVDLSKESIVEDSVYEARFEKYIHDVTFQVRLGDEKYGEISHGFAKVEKGQIIGEHAPRTEDYRGGEFLGWYKDGKRVMDLSKEIIEDDVVYEARFGKYYDDTDIGIGGNTNQPELGGGGSTNQPELGDGDKPTQPELGDGDKPTQPELGDGSRPTQPELGDGSRPTQPELGDGSRPNQPELGDGSRPNQPELGDGNRPNQPELGDGEPSTHPGLDDGTRSDEPTLGNDRLDHKENSDTLLNEETLLMILEDKKVPLGSSILLHKIVSGDMGAIPVFGTGQSGFVQSNDNVRVDDVSIESNDNQAVSKRKKKFSVINIEEENTKNYFVLLAIIVISGVVLLYGLFRKVKKKK